MEGNDLFLPVWAVIYTVLSHQHDETLYADVWGKLADVASIRENEYPALISLKCLFEEWRSLKVELNDRRDWEEDQTIVMNECVDGEFPSSTSHLTYNSVQSKSSTMTSDQLSDSS